MSAPLGRMAKLRGAMSSATRKLGSGAKAVAGKARSVAGSAAARASGAYARLPPAQSILTSWPVLLFAMNVFIAIGGFYMYLAKYNKFRWDSFTVDGKLPFFEIHSHLNVIVFILLALVWTYMVYYINNKIFKSDWMKIGGIFAAIFAGITQLYLFGMFYWLFTGAEDDNKNDLKAANKEADLVAATAADANAAACSTACAGDRAENAYTIASDCPQGVCP